MNSTVQWQVGPERHDAHRVRREASAWLADQQVAPLDDLALIVAELLANAIEAARGIILLDLTIADGRVRVCVTDDGPGFALVPPGALPSPEAESSRGLYLVWSLSEDFHVDHRADRTTVRCVVPLSKVAAPA